MERSRVVKSILNELDRLYPDATCSLYHKNIYQLTIATILSAQCTDEVVNKVTPKLFEKYPDFSALALSDIDDIEQIIKPTGFYKNKAKNIHQLATIITDSYNGALPLNIDILTKLPGIGRKTANVILSEYAQPHGIVVDTHVKRITNRLGLTDHTDPDKIERDLMKIIPKDKWKLISHQLIQHGRKICNAKKPQCEKCTLNLYCKFYKTSEKVNPSRLR